jgi:heme/copper-type cytochrome/quinol oxidase subunit 2
MDIILLHDYFVLFGFMIMSFLFIFLVIYLRKGGLMSARGMFRNLRVNQNLEFRWRIIPIVLLVCIGYPSFCSLYEGGLSDRVKSIGLKVTGHQWY